MRFDLYIKSTQIKLNYFSFLIFINTLLRASKDKQRCYE